jgi:glucokinase
VAQRSGLSKAAVTAITQQLIDEGVLLENGPRPEVARVTRAEAIPAGSPNGAANGAANGTTPANREPASRAGRRPVGLTFNPTYAAVGIELTGGALYGIRLNLAGQVEAQGERTFPVDTAADAVLDQALDLARELLDSRGRTTGAASPVRGVGLVAPGQVDAPHGTILSIPALPQWRGVRAQAVLAQALDVPVRVDWRVYAATLAEQWYGAARQEEDFLYVNVSDGIGMTAVLGGQIHRGKRGAAGQLAHLPLDVPPPAGGRTCVCGNTGCLTTLASVPAVVHRVERALADGAESVLTEVGPHAGRPGLTFDALVAAAHGGDKLAQNALEDTGDYLGRALAILANLFDPPLIVVGGRLTRAGDLLFQPLLRSARRHAHLRAWEGVRLVFSSLQPGPAVVGAATQLLQAALDAAPDSERGADARAKVG